MARRQRQMCIRDSDKPLSEEGRELLQNLIDESYKQFTNAVSEEEIFQLKMSKSLLMEESLQVLKQRN